jgi:hypothetical protein
MWKRGSWFYRSKRFAVMIKRINEECLSFPNAFIGNPGVGLQKELDPR